VGGPHHRGAAAQRRDLPIADDSDDEDGRRHRVSSRDLDVHVMGHAAFDDSDDERRSTTGAPLSAYAAEGPEGHHVRRGGDAPGASMAIVPSSLPAYAGHPNGGVPPSGAPHAGKRYVGSYSPESRRRRIELFHEKRKRRVWTRKVKYDVRKNFADTRMRVKGRFVKKEDEDLLKELLAIV